MSRLVMDPVQAETADAMLLSIVDDEFRALVSANLDAFGLDGLPAPVEPIEQGILTHSGGSQYIAMCASTCSKGPFTVVCDGTSK